MPTSYNDLIATLTAVDISYVNMAATLNVLQPYGHNDLTASFTAVSLSLSIDSVVLSTDYQNVIITYTGYANPLRTDVLLSSYQFSLDGNNWFTMQPFSGTSLSDLTFSVLGTVHTFTWAYWKNIGNRLYDGLVYIRIKPTIDGMDAAYGLGNNLFLKTPLGTTGMAGYIGTGFYSGTPGSELMKNAPPSYNNIF